MATLAEQVEITVGLDDPEDASSLRAAVAKKLGVAVDHLPDCRLIKRSLDARRGRIQFHLLFALSRESQAEMAFDPGLRELAGGPPVVVVGDGPAGLFCAFELARKGIATVVVERGKMVQPRRRDLKLVNARGQVDADSNYCFGEGGAGTFSDGKLYTRSHKRGPVRDVMEILAFYGAPKSILTDARPHIGSNLLPQVIAAMREALVACGTEFLFETCMTDLVSEGQGSERRICGVQVVDRPSGQERTLAARAVVMATGHSARDVWKVLSAQGALLQAKGFAIGVRVEHPQALIDEIQFGRHKGHPKLQAADYKLASQVQGHGVFSFCMCPGGWIVPSLTDQQHLVVNGMSLSKRDSAYANSGLVVSVEPAELEAAGFAGALGGGALQAQIEMQAAVAGGGENRAPATRVTDFVRNRVSADLPATSYLPGITSAPLGEVLRAGGIDWGNYLKKAMPAFERRMRGYLTSEAVAVGVESRTSSPVRVVRDAQTLQSPTLAGLYPCGEGAGYAGGIVSAAVDGMAVATHIAGG